MKPQNDTQPPRTPSGAAGCSNALATALVGSANADDILDRLRNIGALVHQADDRVAGDWISGALSTARYGSQSNAHAQHSDTMPLTALQADRVADEITHLLSPTGLALYRESTTVAGTPAPGEAPVSSFRHARDSSRSWISTSTGLAVLAPLVLITLAIFKLATLDSGRVAKEPGSDLFFNATRLRDGQQMEQDLPKAAGLFKRAADAGHRGAKFEYALMQYHGHGIPQDFEGALAGFRALHANGHTEAGYNVGVMLQRGEGTQRDPVAAQRYFIAAAEKGLADGKLAAALGLMDERLGPVDYAKAMTWLTDPAVASQPRALSAIGTMYADGLGVPVDLQRAATDYETAARAGEVHAAANLARLHLLGKLANSNVDTAVAWTAYAASQGSPDAQRFLVAMFGNGKGVPRDFVSAYTWLLISESNPNNSAPADANLKSALEQRLRSSQRETAMAAADACAVQQHKDCEMPDTLIDRVQALGLEPVTAANPSATEPPRADTTSRSLRPPRRLRLPR
jgi:TPR repeat protein